MLIRKESCNNTIQHSSCSIGVILFFGDSFSLGGLDSVEYYDIASNEWHAAPAMPWRGVTVKCAAVGEVIYVLAGFQGVGRLGHVLEYHIETDRSVYKLNMNK